MRKRAPKKKIQNKSQLLTPLTVISGSVLIVVGLLIITLVSYQIAYLGKIYPLVKVGGINIGNKTQAEARVVLENQFASFKKAGITFSLENEVKNFGLEDLGINFSTQHQLEQAYRIGRSPNLITNLVQKIKAWEGNYDLNPNLTTNQDQLAKVFNYFSQKIPNPPQPARVNFLNDTIEVQPPTDGQILDTQDARQKLTATINSFSISPIILKIQTVKSQVTKADLQSYRQKLQALVIRPPKLVFGNRTWVIRGADLAKLVSLGSGTPESSLNLNLFNQNFAIEKIDQPTNQIGFGPIGLNTEAVTGFVNSLAQDINQDPENAKFSFRDGRVTIFAPSQDGLKLDEKDTINKLTAAFNYSKEATSLEPLPLKVDITKSAVTTAAINNMGIKELIGTGTTTFFHSIPNRAANIALASSRINGTLVAPGEIFSMSKTVGEVDNGTGYKEAYIISEGKTQLDFGGGVCQVSTTLFRTTLNTGLPIVERHPHAYRVGYYEQNSPPGIDASVYFPAVDFKFKNDTGNYILIQTIFDGSKSSLTFNFYGTDDGRSVTMTKPTLYDQLPPPPDLNQDDPTLPLGTVKQVDFAAWGATTSFSRTVRQGGAVIISDSFYSRYQPWRAIYLHGTKPV